MKTLKHMITLIFLLNIFYALFAGSVDYLTNQSVPFLRTLSRGAATDETDIIVYNPAGTTLMKDGLYLSFNWQGFTKDYAIKDLDTGKEYQSSYPSPFIPSAFALLKENNIAFFMAFTIPAGGGTLEYNDGLYMTQDLRDAYFKGTSLYYGYTVGFAYQIDNTLSFSAAMRKIESKKEYKGHGIMPLPQGDVLAKIDSEKTSSTSRSGIFGINLNFDEMNIGIKYETQATLKYKTKSKANDLQLPQFQDNLVEYRDLPAQLSIALSNKFTEDLTLNIGIIYFYLDKAAQNNPAYQEYENGEELQIGGEYKLNDKWLVSAGYNYVTVGGNKNTYTDFEYQLDSHFVGGGFRYTPTEKMHINFALAKPFYKTSKGAGDFARAEYSKEVNIVGVSVEYKIF